MKGGGGEWKRGGGVGSEYRIRERGERWMLGGWNGVRAGGEGRGGGGGGAEGWDGEASWVDQKG